MFLYVGVKIILTVLEKPSSLEAQKDQNPNF